MTEETLSCLKKIRAFVFDVDGVLTDGSLLILEDGIMLRKMDIKDGYAIGQALRKNYKIGIISGSNPVGVDVRLQNLGVEDIYFEERQKLPVLEKFVLDHALNINEVLFMGDDLLDIPPMKRVGISACPADGIQEVRDVATLVTIAPGGRGAVREVIELVMKSQGDWKIPG